MLIEEAKWFGSKIFSINPSDVFPMVDIGCSTRKFREKEQPWVDDRIFKPIKENNQRVVHIDIKDVPGVDMVGNLSDQVFLKELSEMKFKSVICSNFLEHVINKDEVAKAISSLIPLAGYIFVSCPYKYPYHPDPIDTLFRPGKCELAAMFPDAKIIFGEIVTCGTYWMYVTRTPWALIKTMLRLSLPFYKPKGWRIAFEHLSWLSRNFQVTCLVLQKIR